MKDKRKTQVRLVMDRDDVTAIHAMIQRWRELVAGEELFYKKTKAIGQLKIVEDVYNRIKAHFP